MYKLNAVILSGKRSELFHLIRRRQKKSKKDSEFSGQGLRVLAFAYKERNGLMIVSLFSILILLCINKTIMALITFGVITIIISLISICEDTNKLH